MPESPQPMPSLLEQIKEALANAALDEGPRAQVVNFDAEEARQEIRTHAPSWLAALVEEVERLRADVAYLRDEHQSKLAEEIRHERAENERLRKGIDAALAGVHGADLEAVLAAAALEHHARD